MPRAPGQEDWLYPGFEKLEVQLDRRSRRRWRLLNCESNRHKDQGDDDQRYFASDLHDRDLLLQDKSLAEPILVCCGNDGRRGVYEGLRAYAMDRVIFGISEHSPPRIWPGNPSRKDHRRSYRRWRG